jgi:hypothetical protein
MRVQADRVDIDYECSAGRQRGRPVDDENISGRVIAYGIDSDRISPGTRQRVKHEDYQQKKYKATSHACHLVLFLFIILDHTKSGIKEDESFNTVQIRVEPHTWERYPHHPGSTLHRYA